MHAAPERGLNISYPYFCLCLLGASAARARAGWFLGGLLLLLGWALWTRRSRSRSPVFWMASLLLAAGLGLAAQQGLISLQGALQRLDTALMLRFGQAQFPDANESRTMIGAVGKVKLSGRIMLRVNSGDRSPPPLLREASYNLFKSPVWGCAKRDFRVLAPEIDQSTWKLVTNQTSAASVTITELLPGGKGLLALPQGVLELEKLPVFLLESNPLGAVRSSAGPGFVEFNAGYGRGASIDEPPGPDDLQTPTGERQALAQIAAELELEEKTPEEILRSVAAFFMQRFEYSAWLGDSPARGGNPTAIKNFLLRSRKGHCEYFATATTLLLREAGIPARYAVGYAVQERRGGEYLVRARHAHAWCLAYVNGVWREVDTTPASWAAVEAGRASFWEPLSDAWSRGWFSFSKWRFGHSQSRKYLIWLIALPLLGALARLLCAPDWRRVPKPGLPGSKLNLWAGRDSEFYLIEARLAQLGWARQVGETSLAWLRRITATGIANPPGLEKLLALHYRLRFDPDGLVSSDRAELAARAGVWLKDLEGATAHKMALSEHDPTG